MKNSRSLFESAQILAKKGKGYQDKGLFGPATSLLALSHEEYVKAILFAAVATGVAVISSKPVKGAFAFHPTQIRCHACKQELAAWIDITHFIRAIRQVNGSSLEEQLKDIQEILKIKIPEGVDGKFIGMGVPLVQVDMVKRYYDLVSNLWGLKESCFYVDVTGEEIQSPANLPSLIYSVIENIVGSVVDVRHPFEEPENLHLDLLKSILLPSAEEEFKPQPCPHRGAKRARASLTLVVSGESSPLNEDK
jgi:AbiV family abortive infection protein